SRPHHEAIDSRKPHGACDAPTILDGAKTRAVPKVRDYHAGFCEVWGDRIKAGGDIFVGNAVEAITSDPLLCVSAGDCKGLRERRLTPMKGCVEAGDLRQFRTRRADRLDYREIVRLVKRRERNEL